jgi:hypothetical protein
LWIGAKKRSKQKMCKEWDFDWTQTTFNLLGIKFDIDLENMIDLNYSEQFTKIEMEMKLWLARILTPYGRNTILKSLLLPKLNHLFVSIPNPKEIVIQDFQKKCFKFVWQGKPDKVKRNVMVLPPKCGGISIPLIKNTIISQKVSWLKKLFYLRTKWTHHFYHYVNEKHIWLMDSEYIRNKITKNFTNVFWKDVLQSWTYYIDQCKQTEQNYQSTLTQTVWFNNNIKIDNQPLFISNWFNKGVIFINDLLNNNGDVYSFDEFNAIYDIKTNFVTYNGLRRAITKYIKSLGQCINQKLCSPLLPFNIFHLHLNNKGSRGFYQVLLNPKMGTIKSHNLYEDLLCTEYPSKQWENFHLMAQRCTDSTELRWFQFKIIHNILATKYYLFKIGYENSPLCSLCNEYRETIYHIFCECIYSRPIWTNLGKWISTAIERTLTINNEQILLGYKGKNNNPLNVIFILTKQFIYANFKNGNKPQYDHLESKLKTYYSAQKYNAFTDCTYDKFYCFWSSLHTILRQT